MKRISTLAVCGALALTGCGGDDESESTQPPGSGATTTEQPAGQSTTAETAPAEGAAQSGTVEVKAAQIKFVPERVTVKAGSTVRWTNEDPVEHNVVAEDESFKSENFGQGGTFEHTFEEAGSFPYVCTLHPGQEGTVVVQ